MSSTKVNIVNLQVDMVTDMLNSSNFKEEEFCKAMTKQHKTLQQSFTRLCLEWLRTCSKDDYQFDGRNQASHEVAKVLLSEYSFVTVPYV